MTVYVSITGLRLRRAWHGPRFWVHAIRCTAQARAAPGNLHTEARTIDGVHHTLTAWRDRAAMRDYLTGGAHRRAMAIFPLIGTGHVLGYEAEAIPDWDEALRRWTAHGRGAGRLRSAPDAA